MLKDGRTDGPTDDGQIVITIAHPEHSSGELKRAVDSVPDLVTPGFYSWLFLVPKKNGKLRPEIDLSTLNLYIRKQPFKMKTTKSVCQSIFCQQLGCLHRSNR